MPALYFVDLLEKGLAGGTPDNEGESPESEDITIPQATSPGVDRRTLQRVLSELSLVHIGPMADMVVEQARG